MRSIDDYIDLAITHSRLQSGRDLARRLNLSAVVVSAWRTKRNWPSDNTMIALAELSGIDPSTALLELNIWRTSSPGARRFYENILAKVAAVIFATITALTLLPGVADAEGTNHKNCFHIYILCDQTRLRFKFLGS